MIQTPAAMHRAGLYKGVNLSPLLSSSFPTSLLLPFAPQQSCPGPFSHGYSGCEHKNRSENKRIYPDHPSGKRNAPPHFLPSLTHLAALPLMALPCSKLGCCFLQSFTLKDEVPQYHISPSPLSSTFLLYNPWIFSAESKQLVRWCYG